MSELTEPKLIDVSCFSDSRGQLGVIEGTSLPFDIERVYYLFGVPMGAVRGEHGHKKLEQFMVCMSGSCEITLNDGERQFKIPLETPEQGVLVPPGLWRSIQFKEPGSVLCVMASHAYEEEDYLYSYEEYLEWVRENKEAKS